MKTKLQWWLTFAALLTFVRPLLFADVEPSPLSLHPLFTDNMVLQRDLPVPVSGRSAPEEKIKISFAGQEKETVADKEGNWSAKLEPLEASATPRPLTVSSLGNGRSVKIDHILVGDVWVFSGQSNMRRRVSQVKDAQKEIAAANYPNIRLFDVPIKPSGAPSAELTGMWQPCSPESVASFTAVGYFFGRDLYNHLNVPIGLICSCKGGTRAESWSPKEALESNPRFAVAIEQEEQEDKPLESKKKAKGRETAPPSSLYNGMIHPLMPLPIKGVIWYQGESNTGKPSHYALLLSTMIKSWRTAWGQGDFPFLIVQLANYADPRPTRNWPELREAQYLVSKTVPNTGLAVAIDLGQPETIHPLNKQDVGGRLALAARKVAYGEKELISSGPVYDTFKIEGDKIRIKFDGIGSGLEAKGGELKTFTIAGGDAAVPGKPVADEQFVEASARIEGDSVVVWNDQIKNPVAVRYAWSNNPDVCNLYNKEGLPAVPFRTDLPGRPGRDEAPVK